MRKRCDDLEHRVGETSDVEDVPAFGSLRRRVRLDVQAHQPGAGIAGTERGPFEQFVPPLGSEASFCALVITLSRTFNTHGTT